MLRSLPHHLRRRFRRSGVFWALLSPVMAAQGVAASDLATPSPNYAEAATMQRLLHWRRMPVRVCFAPTPAATPDRQRQARDGFDEWVQATGGIISYRLVESPALADVTVTIDPDSTVPDQHGAAGNTSVSFVHDELKSAAMELAAGHTTPNQLQEVAAHEFGHALGIDGHSDKPGDLMAPVEIRLYDPYGSPVDAPAHAVTGRDLNTLKACYPSLFAAPASPQTVSQNTDLDSEIIAPAVPPR